MVARQSASLKLPLVVVGCICYRSITQWVVELLPFLNDELFSFRSLASTTFRKFRTHRVGRQPRWHLLEMICKELPRRKKTGSALHLIRNCFQFVFNFDAEFTSRKLEKVMRKQFKRVQMHRNMSIKI